MSSWRDFMLLTVAVVVVAVVAVVVAAMGVVEHVICVPSCVHRIGQFGRVFKGDA